MTRFTLSLSLLAALVCVAISHAAQPYLVSDRTGETIWRIEDVNGDGDALDIGERTVWADGIIDVLEMDTFGSAVYAVQGGMPPIDPQNRVLRLEDLNGDSDALDTGEQVVWADGFDQAWGIARDNDQYWYVSNAGSDEVWRLADLNADGDALDVGEKTLYADAMPAALSVLFDAGDLFVTAYNEDTLHRLRDLNGDGDALDVGENLIITPTINEPAGLLGDGSGGFFLSSFTASTVYRAVDHNGDGDFLDLAEVLSYADNVFGGVSGPIGMMSYDDAGFLLTNDFGDEVRLVKDINGDGDALDLGEVQLFTDGFTFAIDIIALPAILIGDYNGDGKVSAADFTVWRDRFGAPTLLNRDPENSGPVGPDDFDSWKAHYGEPGGSGAAATANATVPEPAAWLLAIGLVTFFIRCPETARNRLVSRQNS